VGGICSRTGNKLTALAATLVVVFAGPVSADHLGCYFDPAVGALVCPGHEGGGPGEPPEEPDYYYTAWEFVGLCDWTETLQFRRFKIYTDGETPTETEYVCTDPTPGKEAAWDAVEAAIAALVDPQWTANPDGAIAAGLTGLEAWLWYPNTTQVGPIGVQWTDPITGVTSAIEGRGWVGALTWNAAEAEYQVNAASFGAGGLIGGSEESPPARHRYHTASGEAGYSNGYPVSVTLLWVGETRIRPPGAPWFGWNPIPNTLTEVATDLYPVVEVRSRLSG